MDCTLSTSFETIVVKIKKPSLTDGYRWIQPDTKHEGGNFY